MDVCSEAPACAQSRKAQIAVAVDAGKPLNILYDAGTCEKGTPPCIATYGNLSFTHTCTQRANHYDACSPLLLPLLSVLGSGAPIILGSYRPLASRLSPACSPPISSSTCSRQSPSLQDPVCTLSSSFSREHCATAMTQFSELPSISIRALWQGASFRGPRKVSRRDAAQAPGATWRARSPSWPRRGPAAAAALSWRLQSATRRSCTRAQAAPGPSRHSA